MATLGQAAHQWALRPDDERFTSLVDMRNHFETVREESRQAVISSRRLKVEPMPDNQGLEIVTADDGRAYTPTHWSFGQLAQIAEAPAGYLRTVASPIAADCINYGLLFKREVKDVGILVQHNHGDVLRAATGPNFGRIWNSDVAAHLVDRFGDGVMGDWRVPGVNGQEVEINVGNTTFFASDRDMFVFLADERNRIEMPARRNGQSGSLARGFFVWNSEVGDKSFGLGTFFFDYTCANRIVWGAENYSEVRIRHTASAPDKFLEEMKPAIDAYASATASSVSSISGAIEQARKKRLSDKLDEFLTQRFTKRLLEPIKAVHLAEEGRPIETLWDVTTAVTAYARGVGHQDYRVELERKAGKLLEQAA